MPRDDWRRANNRARFGPAREAADKPERCVPQVMWFGMHKGKPLRHVPTDYLHWALKTLDGLTDKQRKALKDELKRRANAEPEPMPRNLERQLVDD